MRPGSTRTAPTADLAMAALVDTTRASEVGLGAVARTLHNVVSGDDEPIASEAAADWESVLALPAHCDD